VSVEQWKLDYPQVGTAAWNTINQRRTDLICKMMIRSTITRKEKEELEYLLLDRLGVVCKLKQRF